jgi:cytoskeletal protein RodZ
VEAQVDALIIVAVVLVAAGLLASVFLWLRKPGSPETEYVTVAELRARLEHEHDVPGESDEAGDKSSEVLEPSPEPATTTEPDSTAPEPATAGEPATTTPATPTEPGVPTEPGAAAEPATTGGPETSESAPAGQEAPDSSRTPAGPRQEHAGDSGTGSEGTVERPAAGSGEPGDSAPGTGSADK